MSLIRVGVDASRMRSGGGVAHLLGVLNIDTPTKFFIDEIHVWGYQDLLDKLPTRSWLIKHHSPVFEGSFFQRLYWQRTIFAKELKRVGCNILLSLDASTLCRFRPLVVLNHSMLSYDDDVMPLFGWGKDRFQQMMLSFLEKRAFVCADAGIFLTRHAMRQVQTRVGTLPRTACIPHGVEEIFKIIEPRSQWPVENKRPIRCLYVSPVHEYKHQTEVASAIKILRDQGVPIEINFVGGGGRRATAMLAKLLAQIDPDRTFVKLMPFIPNRAVADLIADADLFIFASSCETFGIALLEAMTVGVPIACSSRSSMPETLQDAGEYFDPQNPASIAKAVHRLIVDSERRTQIAARAKDLARQYSWGRCSYETWTFIRQVYGETLRESGK
jgi:glycosyltransferase involved in cell wall biosynthesis